MNYDGCDIPDYITPAHFACFADFVFRCLRYTAKVKTDLTIATNWVSHFHDA